MYRHICLTYGDRGAVTKYIVDSDEEFQNTLIEYGIDDNAHNSNKRWYADGFLHLDRIDLEGFKYLVILEDDIEIRQKLYLITNDDPLDFINNKFINTKHSCHQNNTDSDDEEDSFICPFLHSDDDFDMNRLYCPTFNYTSGDEGVHIVNTNVYPDYHSEWETAQYSQCSAIIFIYEI